MRHFSFFIRVVLFGAVLAAASPAHAGTLTDWLNKLFGKDNAPKPEETLIAPFADKGVAVINGPTPQTLTASIRSPHRASRDIGVWAVTAVSNAMSFPAGSSAGQLKDKQSLFDAKGFDGYAAFVNTSGLLNSPDGETYDIRGFVPQEPVLLNEGELDGAYRWLFELPVMVTYQRPGLTEYKDARPLVRSFKIRLQVGRVAEGGGEEGILIESWDGQAVKSGSAK